MLSNVHSIGKDIQTVHFLTLESEAIVMQNGTLTEVKYLWQKMHYIQSDRVKKRFGWPKNCDEKPVMKTIR